MLKINYNIAMVAFLTVGIGIITSIEIASATNIAGLRFITIEPRGNQTINEFTALELSLTGDYATFTMPVEARWSIIQGQGLGTLVGDCSNASSCMFMSENKGGDVIVSAQIGTFGAKVNIHINAPIKAEEDEDDTVFDAAKNPFTDDIPSWAGDPILDLNQRGIIRGYDDGRYGAADLLTWGQMITIFSRTLKDRHLIDTMADCQQQFDDVPGKHYSFKHVCGFLHYGWLARLQNLGADKPVSRGETAALINKVLGTQLLAAQGLSLGDIVRQGQTYSDVSPIHPRFADTSIMKLLGIMTGNADGTFAPDRTLNRAEAAAIFMRVLTRVESAGLSPF